MLDIRTRYRNWRYKNTALLLLSLVLLLVVIDSNPVHDALQAIGRTGYLGVFVVGMCFVSTFTIAPSLAALFFLAQELDPFMVALVAGAGAVVGDYLIFRFFKDGVFEELRPLFERFRGSHLARLFATPHFVWFTPVIGALIIATPFPDEIGIGLLGGSHIKHWQFLLLTFVLNTLGILAAISAGNLL